MSRIAIVCLAILSLLCCFLAVAQQVHTGRTTLNLNNNNNNNNKRQQHAVVESASNNSITYWTVYYNTSSSSYYAVRGVKDTKSGLAWGHFEDEIEETGWSRLNIYGNPNVDDYTIAEAAGYLEGALTYERIFQNKINTFAATFHSKPPPAEIIDFVSKNDQYVRSQVKKYPSDSYWFQIGLILAQFDQLLNGYNDYCPKGQEMTSLDLNLLNLAGDLDDLMNAFDPDSKFNSHTDNWETMTMKEAFSFSTIRSRCSALIKVTPDFGQLFISHTTWGQYSTMLRTFKYLELPFKSAASSGALFSSYPGFLMSDDDFYMLKDTNLTVIETTNDVLNLTLYKALNPVGTVFYWMRVIVANRLATNGEEWANIFSMYNSGTYNNQWMVLDMKLFKPFQELAPNTLWIMEQLPGHTISKDATMDLSLGYWPSFNRPYFPEFFVLAGYQYYTEKYGDIFSYQVNPRAKIFRRDHSKVDSLDAMKAIMLYNDWQHDPYSQGYPGNAIASRFDLKGGPESPVSWFLHGTHGGIDSKVTSYDLFQQFTAEAISGPTCQGQPPFDWSAWPNVSHVGHPQRFDFDWQTMAPQP